MYCSCHAQWVMPDAQPAGIGYRLSVRTRPWSMGCCAQRCAPADLAPLRCLSACLLELRDCEACDPAQVRHPFKALTVRLPTSSYLHRPVCDVLRQTCCACQQDAVVAAGTAILAVSSSCWRYGAGVVDVVTLQLNLWGKHA
jgi:hypothetical protein